MQSVEEADLLNDPPPCNLNHVSPTVDGGSMWMADESSANEEPGHQPGTWTKFNGKVHHAGMPFSVPSHSFRLLPQRFQPSRCFIRC